MISYKLVQKAKEEWDTFKVTIIGDSNDADYITETERYSKKKFEEVILPGLNDLHKNASESYQLEDYENEFDLSVPHSDNVRCHSLEEVMVEYTDRNGMVWDVEIDYEEMDDEGDDE